MGWSEISNASKSTSLSTEFFGLFGGGKTSSKVFKNFTGSLKRNFYEIDETEISALNLQIMYKFTSGREWIDANLHNIKVLVECAEEGIDDKNIIKRKLKFLDRYFYYLNSDSKNVVFCSIYFEQDDVEPYIPDAFVNVKNLPNHLKAYNLYDFIFDDEYNKDYRSGLRKLNNAKDMYFTMARHEYLVWSKYSDRLEESYDLLPKKAYNQNFTYQGKKMFNESDSTYLKSEVDKIIDRINKIENTTSAAAKYLSEFNRFPGYYFPDSNH